MKQEFNAVIQQHEGINGAYVEIPFDVEEIFGAKRVKVAATFDGALYRGSIVRMGGIYLIGLTRQLRGEINKDFGDTVFVTVEKDEAERVVEMPPDFEHLLKQNTQAQSFWNTLSFSGQKKYTDWAAAAKGADTRAARIEKAVGMLESRTKIK